MFASFLVLDRQEAVTCPPSSKGCVNMLYTTRPLKISPRRQSAELLCGISVLYTSLHFQGAEFFSCVL